MMNYERMKIAMIAMVKMERSFRDAFAALDSAAKRATERIQVAKQQLAAQPCVEPTGANAPDSEGANEKIKNEISDVIRTIVANDERYWLEAIYIRWGAVERDLHAIIDRNLTQIAPDGLTPQWTPGNELSQQSTRPAGAAAPKRPPVNKK